MSRRLGKTEANWQSCSLRKWLNNEFLNSAFSLNEQKMINTVAVKPHKNKVYDTDCGSTTSDKVFLLSATEMEKYYKSNALRKSQPTEFAKKQKVLTGGIIKKTAYYWLRTSGKDLSYATVVDSEGLISEYGNLVLSSKYGVRPAMWIRC